MIYGYSRVSSSEQSEDSYALQQQTARLKEAGAEIVLEEVASRSRSDRKLFKRLQELMKAGEVTEVVVTRVDRVGGSLPALREFASLCLSLNVNLRILDQQLDLSTPHGRLMFNMLGSMAEWEIDMLKSRVEAGLKHQRAEGRVPGIIPFGYRRVDDRYAPNLDPYRDTEKTCWEVAREIIETFLRVQTVRGTAREMGERYGPRQNTKGGAGFEDFPRENGLKYWLKSPVLSGDTAYFYRSGKKNNKPIEIIKGTHPALVTPAERAEIDRILSIPLQGVRNFDEPLPLAGLLYCSKCDRKMRALRFTKGARKVVRWYCSGQHSAPRACDGVTGHRNEAVTNAIVDALVQASDRVSIEASADECSIEDSPEVKELLVSLAQLEGIASNAAIEDAKRSIAQQIQNLRIEASRQIENQGLLQEDFLAVGRNPDFWLQLEKPIQRRLFRQFVEKIICSESDYIVNLRI